MAIIGNRRQRRLPGRKATAPRAEGARRLPGVDIKAGSVKQARTEAGLSLAKVADGHVSAPAIYLIETGRSRPSLPTLEHIARRTGKSVEYFLADPAAGDATHAGLQQLEDLIAQERLAEAIACGEDLLRLATSANRLGNIRFLLAQAHLKVGRPDLAIPLLRDAHEHFEASGDQIMLAECLGSEATAAYMTQEPKALELAEKGLELCMSLRPVPSPTQARLLAILATVHSVNREWNKAITFYEKAIEAAGSLYDLGKLAKIYGGLAWSYRETGQVDAAAKYASRSVALLEVLRDRVSLARAENELGLLLLAKGDHDSAHEHLERSLELATETHLEVGRSHFLLSLCELSLSESNLEHARRFAEQALALSERLGEPANVAESHLWLGRVAAGEGDTVTTDREFTMAMRLMGEGGYQERLVRCHSIYAEVLEARGEMDRAYEYMKKALAAARPGLLINQEPAEDESERSA